MTILDLVAVSSGTQFGNCCGNEIGWARANAVQDTWYDILDASMVDGQLFGVTHDGNGKLTIGKTGAYAADWAGAFESNAANVHLQLAFSINGTEDGACVNHIETVGANRQSTAAGNSIYALEVGDTVNVSMRTTDAGTPNLAVDHLMLRLILLTRD